jgi:hypothetical protein
MKAGATRTSRVALVFATSLFVPGATASMATGSARSSPQSAQGRDAGREREMLVPLQKEVSGEDQLELPALPCPQASRRLPWMACRTGLASSCPDQRLVSLSRVVIVGSCAE